MMNKRRDEMTYDVDVRLIEAGFVDVVEHEVPPGMLINSWPEKKEHKLVGKYSHIDLARGIDSGVRFQKLAGLSHEEITHLVARAKQDLANPEIHAYYPV